MLRRPFWRQPVRHNLDGQGEHPRKVAALAFLAVIIGVFTLGLDLALAGDGQIAAGDFEVDHLGLGAGHFDAGGVFS